MARRIAYLVVTVLVSGLAAAAAAPATASTAMPLGGHIYCC